ncbi:AraC family transcriptional regulator [Hyalangium rubrum]|uniref:AraC family transcriptional regulator n=1 Tax=Hyalangium rubrum TaxID=3103134 RepID=A0ABU5GUP3_9BACT|nr:AraC family transcriptional regulator [Hyalangium sp. s54d21]MDY7224900.1 AraC family transcriptional regulator [Hyalangium sp. s54d21]
MLAQAAAARGARVDDLLARHGVEPALLEVLDARVPHALLVDLWEHVPRRLGDASLGLRLAQVVPLGTFELVEYCMRNSADLATCYQKLIRWQRLLHDAAGYHFELKGDVARLSHRPAPSLEVPPQATGFILAKLVTIGRQLTGVAFMPRTVSLSYPRPVDDTEHTKVFGTGVRFSQPEVYFEFDRAVFDLRIQGMDPQLSALLERYAQRRLEEIPQAVDWVDDLAHRIRQALRGSVPDAATLARQLGMSTRTLSRRLHERGLTFQEVVDQARKELALRQLLNKDLKVLEVAFQLGFSEVSTFYRAFRRWTGTTPAAYRREAMGT